MSRRLLSLVCAVTALTAVSLSSAFAQAPGNANKNTRYLALGDSIPFGYDPTIVPPDLSKFVGYPQLVSSSIHENLANASCPGESSGSFLSATAPDLGCRAWRAALPLFVPYSGTQADYAISYLQNNKHAELVTINIGGNDLGLLQISCQNVPACEVAGLPAVLANYAQNLARIYARIRFEARYSGTLVAVTYYAFNYSDPLQVQAFTAFNTVTSQITTLFGGKVADGFGAFQQASAGYNGDACAAGLLGKLPDGTCGTHPSPEGQKLLANAVLSVLPDKH